MDRELESRCSQTDAVRESNGSRAPGAGCAASLLDINAQRQVDRRRLGGALVLTGAFMVLEVAGGFWSGSLALLSDAGHMATDVAALLLSFAAVWLTSRPADARRTYGYYRFEVLCALLNGAVLLPVSAAIGYEAWHRFQQPHGVLPGPMLGIAVVGLVANVLVYVTLRRSKSMNVRAAVLHVMGDALSSLGVIAAGVVVWSTGWLWVDPLVSIAIAAAIVVGAFRLTREAVDVLLEAVPAHLDLAEVLRALQQVEGVAEVHDLHVWSLTSQFNALSAHLVVTPTSCAEYDAILACAQKTLRERFCIEHATLQVESLSFARVAHRRE